MGWTCSRVRRLLAALLEREAHPEREGGVKWSNSFETEELTQFREQLARQREIQQTVRGRTPRETRDPYERWPAVECRRCSHPP